MIRRFLYIYKCVRTVEQLFFMKHFMVVSSYLSPLLQLILNSIDLKACNSQIVNAIRSFGFRVMGLRKIFIYKVMPEYFVEI